MESSGKWIPAQGKEYDEEGKEPSAGAIGNTTTPVVFGHLRAGIAKGKHVYHRDNSTVALPSGTISLSCFMSLSGDLIDLVGNAFTSVMGGVRGLSKLWVAPTWVSAEGNLWFSFREPAV